MSSLDHYGELADGVSIARRELSPDEALGAAFHELYAAVNERDGMVTTSHWYGPTLADRGRLHRHRVWLGGFPLDHQPTVTVSSENLTEALRIAHQRLIAGEWDGVGE